MDRLREHYLSVCAGEVAAIYPLARVDPELSGEQTIGTNAAPGANTPAVGYPTRTAAAAAANTIRAA